jgi:maspardin
MKKRITLVVIIGLIVLYFYPPKQYSFGDTYPQHDDISASLAAFRSEPLQILEFQNQYWNYHVTHEGDTAILFLHGMGGSYDIWWQQINHFRTKYKTVSLTYPPVNSLEELSEGILAVLAKENIDKVHIVGSSLGGYLTQYIAVNHPEKVLNISLGNTFPPNDIIKAKNGKLSTRLAYVPEWFVIKTFRKKYNEEVIPAANNSPNADAFLNELLGKAVNKEVLLARYKCVIDPFQPNVSNKIPTQIIESDNDPLVEKQFREMLKTTYPTASVVTLHNEGHFPYLSNAVQYNSLIVKFLNQ